jgi:hypothetical protein
MFSTLQTNLYFTDAIREEGKTVTFLRLLEEEEENWSCFSRQNSLKDSVLAKITYKYLKITKNCRTNLKWSIFPKNLYKQ